MAIKGVSIVADGAVEPDDRDAGRLHADINTVNPMMIAIGNK
jgi:hypothetical protein